ncbi:ATP-binding cassette domain-containing protein [Budviciaceae bacterium BWR-B9]|uniref:ATP-binding cassette domain-containing protein n=1 Tax=Limnobaculum allomyrinae TaxID=2791986 RepID=A0ABS1IVE7_9GAMM|nr:MULTISPECIES: ATP-binding cassette domain-containing protein [Limnobaculum]MBK5145719.1 ATP-binding cassette domain-containing protein [Limnobaculum allomyrinae]MBV7693747.1 ATP-binding cassette domain-containing protein [Limnobaculum sp. M2-1]
MLTFNNVSFRWPKASAYCLNNLSLNLNQGEHVALVGDNGAGKSTLLRLAAGLLKADEGLITLNGLDLSQQKAQQRAMSIGILFQEAEKQIFHSSVKDEITFGLKQRKLTQEQIEQYTKQALIQCELTELADKHPLDLHAGQRRMVAVACLAALSPPLLLLDEPSRDFDAHWLSVFERWLAACKQSGTTILTISHDLDFVARHYSRVIHLSGGKIVNDGSPSQVLSSEELQEPGDLPSPTLYALNQALSLDYPGNPEEWSHAWLHRTR